MSEYSFEFLCQPGPVSVQERKPIDGGDVLIYVPDYGWRVGWYYRDDDVWFVEEQACSYGRTDVSHWMPLPPAPEEASR